MQRGVHGRLMDNSTSVREAAVELVGRFVLSRPELIEQYYDMLIERILVISYSSFITLLNFLSYISVTIFFLSIAGCVIFSLQVLLTYNLSSYRTRVLV